MIALDGSHRLGGAALVAGSLLFFLNKVDDMSRLFLGRRIPDLISGEDIPLILVGQLCLFIGFAGMYRAYVTRLKRPGRIALRLLCGGGMLLALGHVTFMIFPAGMFSASWVAGLEYAYLLVAVGLLLVFIGLIGLGSLNLRRPLLGPWPWLPLATGIAGFVGFALLKGEAITAGFLLFRTLFALGLVALGFGLWRGPSTSRLP